MISDVKAPPHYTAGGIETKDYIRAKLGKQGYIDYCYGNILKYSSRAKYKEQELKDVYKIVEYATFIIEELEKEDA